MAIFSRRTTYLFLLTGKEKYFHKVQSLFHTFVRNQSQILASHCSSTSYQQHLHKCVSPKLHSLPDSTNNIKLSQTNRILHLCSKNCDENTNSMKSTLSFQNPAFLRQLLNNFFNENFCISEDTRLTTHKTFIYKTFLHYLSSKDVALKPTYNQVFKIFKQVANVKVRRVGKNREYTFSQVACKESSSYFKDWMNDRVVIKHLKTEDLKLTLTNGKLLVCLWILRNYLFTNDDSNVIPKKVLYDSYVKWSDEVNNKNLLINSVLGRLVFELFDEMPRGKNLRHIEGRSFYSGLKEEPRILSCNHKLLNKIDSTFILNYKQVQFFKNNFDSDCCTLDLFLKQINRK